MKKGDKLIDWAMEIQAIGQTGLATARTFLTRSATAACGK